MDIKKFVLSYYTNATKNFHITRITVPEEALKLHSHDYFQVYYVTRGKMVHHIENDKAQLNEGDVFILPPDMPHYIEATDNIDFFSLSFLPDFFGGANEGNTLIYDFLYYLKTGAFEKILPRITLSEEDSTFSRALCERISYEFENSNVAKSELIKGSVCVLLSLFARVYFEENGDALVSALNKNTILHCMEYINNHYDEDITLSQIIKLSAMSKATFCRSFLAVTGLTFKNYLNNTRIQKGAELILKGEKMSVASSLCGYSDLSTFGRNFKKFTKLTPREYKKMFAEK